MQKRVSAELPEQIEVAKWQNTDGKVLMTKVTSCIAGISNIYKKPISSFLVQLKREEEAWFTDNVIWFHGLDWHNDDESKDFQYLGEECHEFGRCVTLVLYYFLFT